MSGRVLRCLAVAVLCGFACSSQVLELDAKSRELIGRADAALAKAQRISLVQTRGVVRGQEAEPVEETAILAARPGFFRVEQKGDEAELTVANGSEWVCFLTDLDVYQRTEVADFSPADLFRPPAAEAMLTTGRGLTSLWLGRHSLATLLAGASECTYGGTETAAGVAMHRIDGVFPRFRLSLHLSAEEPTLPLRMTLARGVGDGGEERVELAFGEWRLDPPISSRTFVFLPPRGSSSVSSVERFRVWRRKVQGRDRSGAPRGQPFPSGQEVTTNRTYKAALMADYVAYQKRQYEAHGHRDPKWDQAMLDLQEAWAGRLFHDQSVARLADLRDRIAYLQSVGCQDATLAFLDANITQYLKSEKAAEPMLEPAWQALQGSAYPASVKMLAARRYLGFLRRDRKGEKALIEQASEQWTTWLAEAAAEPDFGDGKQRLFAYLAAADWETMHLGEKRQVIRKMTALPGAEPWILAYYTGRWRIEEAWNSRGDGDSQSVGDEGWRGFAEHIRAAKRELTKAWKLHPEFPEPAEAMITVSMGEQSEKSLRLWFDRTIAAQLDWGEAYDKLRWAYRTRWYGTPTWTYELGLEAARTGRFDTNVPHQYWLCLLDMLTESETWQKMMARPEALPALRAVCEGYLAADEAAFPSRYLLTVWLIGCWGAGQGEEGLAVLRRLDFQPDLMVCNSAKVDPDRLVGEVALLGTSQGETMKRGLHLLNRRDYAAAVPLLRQAMLAIREENARAYVYLGDQICNVPLVDAPEVADTVLDTIIELRRREVLVQSFIRWMDEAPDEVPAAFQDRVAAYLGPVSWAFMPEAPVASELGDEEIDAGLARLDALTLADIPGADTLPAEEANDLFATEKILAKLRLHYCRQLTGKNQSSASWRYCREHVVPLIKPTPHRGLLLEFVTEHQNPERHSYHRELQRGVKTWIQAQGMLVWDAHSDSFLPQLAELGRIADGSARTQAAWKLFQRRGSVRFGFQLKQVLDQSGATLDAALMERYLVSHLAGQDVPYRDAFGSFIQANAFNYIPGYEHLVIGNGERYEGMNMKTSEPWLPMADAYLRLGELAPAIAYLWKYEGREPDSDWMYMAGERCKGSDEAMKALIRAISRHPAATPETLDLLERLFPERLAQANAQ